MPSQRSADNDSTTLPVLALREADTHRSVRAYFAVGIVSSVGVIVLLALGGVPWVKWTLVAVVSANAAFSFWLAWTRRREGVFSDGEASVAGMLMCTCAVLGVAYAGPLTAPAAMLVAVITGLALGDPARARRGAVVLIAGYGIVSIAAVLGHLPPVSPLLVSDSATSALLGVVFVEAVLVTSFLFGVTARSATANALEHVQRARIALAGREAMLQEAFDDLRRLAGGQGRLTGSQMGNYRLETLLGRGGMGEVYRGRDLDRGVSVAVKVLHANLVPETTLVERFFREADISSELASPHIVRVLDHGTTSDQAPYLVMELIEGRSLIDILRDVRKLPLARVRDLCASIADALAVAHDARIVHRDVKPANITLDDDDAWKLLDFGISKLHTSTGTLTRGGPIGTPGYMSPEQALGGDVDTRTDIFAFGVVLYRALTGRAPFRGEDPVATVFNSVHQQPLQPSSFALLPVAVEWVLALALAKRKSDRFQTARDLAVAFEAACEDRLAPGIRDRANALLSEMPWGREVTASEHITGREGGPDGDTVTFPVTDP